MIYFFVQVSLSILFPSWIISLSNNIKISRNSKFLKLEKKFNSNKHTYFSGSKHCSDDLDSKKFISPFDTVMFVLQNDEGYKKWGTKFISNLIMWIIIY